MVCALERLTVNVFSGALHVYRARYPTAYERSPPPSRDGPGASDCPPEPCGSSLSEGGPPRALESLAHQPNLVSRPDLTLLSAKRWRAGYQLDQIMAAHLQEATI